MRHLPTILACMLLCSCASQPATPRERADNAAAMGMLLIAGAAQEQGSAASALWQVRISPPVFEVLGRVQAYRRTSGVLPKREEIALPEGVTELLLNPAGEDLLVEVKKESVSLIRCRILKEGTVVVTPPLEEIMSTLPSHFGTRAPVVPVVLPPKK